MIKIYTLIAIALYWMVWTKAIHPTSTDFMSAYHHAVRSR